MESRDEGIQAPTCRVCLLWGVGAPERNSLTEAFWKKAVAHIVWILIERSGYLESSCFGIMGALLPNLERNPLLLNF